jgi:hypothetical protein
MEFAYPTDLLQHNSNLLQRNSNITAIEFEHSQTVCVYGVMLQLREMTGGGGKWWDFDGIKYAKISSFWRIRGMLSRQNPRLLAIDLCGIDLQ